MESTMASRTILFRLSGFGQYNRRFGGSGVRGLPTTRVKLLESQKDIPSVLRIRALSLSGKLKPVDAVSERRKLKFPEMQEELIKEEEEREEVEQARMEINSSQDDKALKEISISTAKEAHQLDRAAAMENKEQLCELSRASADLASASVGAELALDKSPVRHRSEEEVRAMFEEWIVDMAKVYHNLEEKEQRFQNFKHNLRYIDEHNAENHSYTLGLTCWADISSEEILLGIGTGAGPWCRN